MADSLSWLADFADRLLHHPTTDPVEPLSPNQPQPLAVLLFYLDCLSFLHNTPSHPASTLTQVPAPDSSLDGAQDDSSDVASVAGRVDGSSGVASQESEDSDSTEDFIAYLEQVYLASGTPLAVGPGVELTGDSTLDPHSNQAILANYATTAQAWIISQSDLSCPPQLASLPSSSHLLPPPFGPSLLATIASTLASSRQQHPTARPPTLTFRWILSSILNHYFPTRYGQQMDHGVSTYARDAASDAALQSYHKRISHLRFSSNDDDEPTSPLDLEADRAEGIRTATLSIAKRDDKMRWLLGDNFQQRPNGQDSFRSSDRAPTMVNFPHNDHAGQVEHGTSSSPRQPRRGSHGSLDSALPETNHHSRTASAASSRTPLLDPESPSRVLMHRRGISVPSLHGGYELPALSPSVPFANFDLIAPVSPSDKRIRKPASGAPASPTFTRSSPGGAAASVPPPKNSLSQDAKRDLVKRSKKLEQMFGVPLEEAAAERVLVGGQPLDGQDAALLGGETTPTRPGKGRRRSASFPPPSPTSASFEDGNFFLNASPSSASTRRLSPPNLGSVGMVRSYSSPNSTSPTTDDVFLPDTPTLANAVKFSALGGSVTLQKEERRRKLAKLQRLLGERVPAELALNQAPGRGLAPGGYGMGRSGSRLGGMLKGKLGFGRAHEEGHGRRDEGFVVVDQNALAASEHHAPSSTAPLKGLARARKLEQMFGDLPPPNLYRGKASEHQTEPLRRVSSTCSTARSIHSFRTSIASLQYLAVQDPDGLDRITEEYASSVGSQPTTITIEGPSPTLSQGTDEDDRADEDEAAVAAAKNAERRESAQSASSSASHRRTVKKAQKLASFFGTTRGEVWGLLLDDLEAAIVEEDGLDDEERAEVLGGVHRLRQTAV